MKHLRNENRDCNFGRATVFAIVATLGCGLAPLSAGAVTSLVPSLTYPPSDAATDEVVSQDQNEIKN